MGLLTLTQYFDDQREDNERREHNIQLVEAGKGPPKFFETSEDPLDFIAASIDDLVIFPWDKMVGIWGNHRYIGQFTSQTQGFIAFIGTNDEFTSASIVLTRPGAY